MTPTAVDFISRLVGITGVAESVISKAGFSDQAEFLLSRGFTPEHCAVWINKAKTIIGDIELNKGVDIIAHGFSMKLYPGQGGVFISKSLRVGDMPYMNEHAVDEDYIFADSMARVEIIPGGGVQLYISDSDYLESDSNYLSQEGWALLKDAMPQ